MPQFLIVYLAGALTVLSPCILPVLPFAFARAGRPFATSTLPLLAGMVAAFAAVATLAAVGGGWVVRASEAGRFAALCLLAAFAVTLVSRRAAAWLHAPLVRLGEAVSRSLGGGASPGVAASLCLGAATGLLWTPCAGPILGLVLTAAALNGPGPETTLLLAAYAAGAATALAGAVLAGGPVVAALRRRLGLGERLRQLLGAAMLAALAAVTVGFDATVLTRFSAAGTQAAEERLLDGLHGGGARAETGERPVRSRLPVEGRLPSLAGASQWLNGDPPTAGTLRGKVLLVHVWTYSCINCIRTIPYVRAWEARYRDRGLAVIGIHAPEFAFERDVDNVAQAVRRLALPYPVAVDNDFRLWRALRNAYWPALYVVDAEGRIRHHQFGEGGYAQAEAAIQDLLAEAAGRPDADALPTVPPARGAEIAPDPARLESGETYLGAAKAERFASPEGLGAGAARDYTPGRPRLDEWSLSGTWTIRPEHAALERAGGAITYRFRARDLHLVLGPGPEGRPVRFTITLDGAAPGADHGTDSGPDGTGVVTQPRLYQLVRQAGAAGARTFEIRFLDPGARAYAFTFG
ncbi:Protein DipZ [Methylobacterium crusticola]|uniref:Protein DipZ n=1 Tax=Methylobacterium crusticola TaxID=1697972 RepID=A0ABQ4QVP9_9HYPH|nr:redoxin domain-containing protein [Methylobacterium crusticola]GJD49437.1 Protein DipZ [Methylobacterium crusticola]